MSKRSSRDDPRYAAAVELIGRTGADHFQLRYCEEEEPPVVWIAAAQWNDHWEAAGAMNPLQALFRLLDSIIDGGQCKHCRRATAFEPSADPMPFDKLMCWYQFDPSTEKFVRGCA